MRRAVPWLGFLLLAISFVWFLRLQGGGPTGGESSAQLAGKKERLVVVLDPGHGGDDSGAMCGAVME
jgi:hypothetical protein